MNRCSFREWIPILPWPVWPLAGQCLLGQKTVVGSMRILLLAVRGNIARRSMSGPRFLYNFTTPRLGVELPREENRQKMHLRLWRSNVESTSRDLTAFITACAQRDTEAMAAFQETYGVLIYTFPMRVFRLPEDKAGDFYLYAF